MLKTSAPTRMTTVLLPLPLPLQLVPQRTAWQSRAGQMMTMMTEMATIEMAWSRHSWWWPLHSCCPLPPLLPCRSPSAEAIAPRARMARKQSFSRSATVWRAAPATPSGTTRNARARCHICVSMLLPASGVGPYGPSNIFRMCSLEGPSDPCCP